MRILTFLFLFVSQICIVPRLNAQEIFVEASGIAGSGEYAPLWLVSNKNGVTSPYLNSAYERAGINGSLQIDSAMQLKVDYGLDLIFRQNAQSKFLVHEAFADVSFKKVHLIVGQKEHKLDFRYQNISSGGLGYGINAQPIPMVMVNVDYFSFPGTNQWWKVRGRLGYGKTTDGAWQERWAKEGSRYTTNTLYCERALMWKFGKEEVFPLVLEASLQMMTQFGGTSYNTGGRNHHDGKPIVHPETFNAFWHALWPMGSSDVTDGNMPNSAGNTFGSYIFSLQWHGNHNDTPDNQWHINAYFERMFEDQSMLTVQYGIYDHLLGLEVGLKKNPYVSHFVIEHISSKDQAGPVYHDKSPNMPESYTGMDNYYNHGLFTGWQHWGIGMGNPLFIAPIYNDYHVIKFYDNRLRALHIGVDGNPNDELSWRIMASFTRNWGTYALPYPDVINQQYYLAEINYKPWYLNGWAGTLGLGLDHGSLIKSKSAVQLTLRKTFKL